jgi:hypothetical protein
MGTRALTYIQHADFEEDPFCAIYRQMDGYPDCHGVKIHEALGSKKLVNGMSGDRDTVVNGMGCAAAVLIRELKDKAGSIYIENPSIDDSGVSYVYRLGCVGEPGSGGEIHLRVTRCYDDKQLYQGPLSAFDGATIEAEGGAA